MREHHAIVTCRECGPVFEATGNPKEFREDLKVDAHLRQNPGHYLVQRLHPTNLCAAMDPTPEVEHG